MTIVITRMGDGGQPGKLAEAEIRFDASEGALDGLKMIGFAVWERRGSRGLSDDTGKPLGRNVTFPARQYSVNGERRSFSLLRSTGDTLCGQDRIVALILQAYADHEDAIGKAAEEHAWSAVEGYRTREGARF